MSLRQLSTVAGKVIAADLSAEQRKAYYDAENMAVETPINADFYKSAHHVAAHTKRIRSRTNCSRPLCDDKHVDYYGSTLFWPDL